MFDKLCGGAGHEPLAYFRVYKTPTTGYDAFSSQGIDTSEDNPAGRLQLAALMAVAEFEGGIIKDRVKAGLAAAKARVSNLADRQP